jgi:putative acetyltransferase
MDDLSFRKATPSDAAVLHALRARSILELAPSAMPIEEVRKWAERGSAESMLRRLKQTEVWVAEVPSQIVGWVAVRDGDYLDALYVDPRFARRGIGSRLLRLVEDLLCGRGISVIRADASWNAEGFYIRCGYEPLGPRPPADARPMRKHLLDKI